MAAEEFDFPLDDVVEGDSAVVDVVVAALAAVQFCLGCAIGDGERGTDRCLGVVFGDIGTSPITIQTAFNPNDPLPVPISTDNVYGVVSLIFWSVMIIVTLTYVTLVMRADNDGGGSIMALITLLRRYGGARGRRTAMTLAALGLFGAALFFGESMITPCDLARVR